MSARPYEKELARQRRRRVVIPVFTTLGILAVWQVVVQFGIVPNFLLPSPTQVIYALVTDIALLAGHAATTLVEAAVGLVLGVGLGFVIAVLMDRFEGFYLALKPLKIGRAHV